LRIGTKNNFAGIALSGVSYNGNIEKSHILINTNSDEEKDKKYLFHLMVHELGHLMGLRDIKNISDYSIMSYKKNYEKELTSKDVRNLNWLYNGKFEN
jgi:predicted Zn-dependent protease